MPLYEFYCDACNKPFEAFRQISDIGEKQPCERCGSSDTRKLISRFVIVGGEIDTSTMDPLEKELHLQNKTYIESHAQDIIDGKMTITKGKRGPKEFEPEIPYERKVY